MARRAGRYADWGRTYAAFSDALLDCGHQLTKKGQGIIIAASERFLRETDAEWPRSTKSGKRRFGGDHNHPWYYGQLHDSVAIRIADKNHTIAIRYMPQAATHAQHTSAADTGEAYRHIIGAEWAARVANNAQYVFLPGTQAQLIIGVPYARKVDEMGRHAGYIGELQNEFLEVIEEALYDLEGKKIPYTVKPRK